MTQIRSQAWFEVESGQVESTEFCGGIVANFSQRCPTRDTTPNEDAACLVEVTPALGLVAVADGVGGAVSGNKASRAAIERLIESCQNSKDGTERESRGLRAEILDAIELTNHDILSWGSGAGTTLTAVEICKGWIRAFHIGDSNALLISNRGNIKFATVGHAPVAQAVEIGLLDEDLAMVHEDRNLITNCLGSSEMKIEIGSGVKMAVRDTLLVASDGLFDNLNSQEVVSIISSGNLITKTKELSELAIQRMKSQSKADTPSKPDDLTIICFRQSK
jgi:serine/threonine protein phosphatase PrpC